MNHLMLSPHYSDFGFSPANTYNTSVFRRYPVGMKDLAHKQFGLNIIYGDTDSILIHTEEIEINYILYYLSIVPCSSIF